MTSQFRHKLPHWIFTLSICLCTIQCGLSNIRPSEIPEPFETTQTQSDDDATVDESSSTANEETSNTTSPNNDADTQESSAPRKQPPAPDEISTSANDSTTSSESSAEPTFSFRWDRVLLSEIVTDPQQDHNESSPSNSILFDPYPGTGQVTSSDEYVEIYNGLDHATDLSSWQIAMRDGTDETQSLSDPTLVTYFSKGGSIENVQAGEFVVLGNPKGILNNEIAIELYDATETVVDSVSVDDGNASALENEAFDRLDDGSWSMGFASPGY